MHLAAIAGGSALTTFAEQGLAGQMSIPANTENLLVDILLVARGESGEAHSSRIMGTVSRGESGYPVFTQLGGADADMAGDGAFPDSLEVIVGDGNPVDQSMLTVHGTGLDGMNISWACSIFSWTNTPQAGVSHFSVGQRG